MGYVSFNFKVSTKPLVAIALLVTVLVMVAVGALGLSVSKRAWGVVMEDKDLVADIAIATIAHYKAGELMDSSDIDYSNSQTDIVWGMETNSRWLVDYTRLIVPMLVYEKISVGDGMYPPIVVLLPYSGVRSEHISGSMSRMWGMVMVNERHVLDGFWRDKRDTLVTLVHELIHAQGGFFLIGTSEQLEAATSSATIEALAGMCNFGDDLACKSFWVDLEQTARNDLRARLVAKRKDHVFRFIAGILWQNEKEERYYEKKSRYWSEHMEEFEEVLAKYYMNPWRETIIPGILDGKVLNTGLSEPIGPFHQKVVGMPYDDSSRIVGWFVKLLMRLVIL